MAELYSQYFSGTQFTAGAIVGSALGASGLNPIVDRLNSISTDNNIITGSLISGTNTQLNINSINVSNFQSSNLGLQMIKAGTFTISSPTEIGIVFNSSSGTGVDWVTNNNADMLEVVCTAILPVNGFYNVQLVVSGEDNNIITSPFSGATTGGGGAGRFSFFLGNPGAIGGTPETPIEARETSTYNVETRYNEYPGDLLNGAGSVFLKITGSSVSLAASYQFRGFMA